MKEGRESGATALLKFTRENEGGKHHNGFPYDYVYFLDQKRPRHLLRGRLRFHLQTPNSRCRNIDPTKHPILQTPSHNPMRICGPSSSPSKRLRACKPNLLLHHGAFAYGLLQATHLAPTQKQPHLSVSPLVIGRVVRISGHCNAKRTWRLRRKCGWLQLRHCSQLHIFDGYSHPFQSSAQCMRARIRSPPFWRRLFSDSRYLGMALDRLSYSNFLYLYDTS